MIRILISAIIGFLVWSVLWIGSDAVFMAISPTYKEHIDSFSKALETKQAVEMSSILLLLTLSKSFICSIIAGLVTVMIAKENLKSTLILGVFLLAFGIFIQSIYWNYLPLWYHLIFLLMLIPMSIFGGKLKKT